VHLYWGGGAAAASTEWAAPDAEAAAQRARTGVASDRRSVDAFIPVHV
jgi:hypothetical protein